MIQGYETRYYKGCYTKSTLVEKNINSGLQESHTNSLSLLKKKTTPL